MNLIAAHPALLRKFTDLAFDEWAEMRWQESRPTEADNMDVGPVTETDLQSDLMEASGNPYKLVKSNTAIAAPLSLREHAPQKRDYLRKSLLWSEDFTAKLFSNVEFWLERLPKLI